MTFVIVIQIVQILLNVHWIKKNNIFVSNMLGTADSFYWNNDQFIIVLFINKPTFSSKESALSNKL